MMMLYSIILGALIIWRVIVPLKLSVKWKIVISGIVALVALKFYIMRLFGGELFFTPDAPGWVLLPVTWLFVVMIFFAIWVIGWEVLVLIVRVIAGVRKKKLPAVFTGVKWKLYGLVPVILLVSVGMYNGLKTPDVVEYEIVIKDLPRAVDGLKIAHLSDIHADPFTTEEKVRRIVELTNEQGADLVVITGDFVDGRIGVRGEDLEPLRKLNAPMGVFGVPGNHEYYSGYAPWVDFIRGCGVRMLENSHVILGNGEIALGGVTDPAAKHRGGDLPDINRAFSGAPEHCLKILLAHQPKLAKQAAQHGVDLQLSGHTHGGMIYGMDLLVGIFNQGFVSGTYDVDGMKLHISNGTGIWNGFPVRFGHPSEIVLITLKAEQP